MNTLSKQSSGLQYWKWVGVFIIVLIAYTYVINAYNHTVAPTWMYAQHGYLPWKNQNTGVEKRFKWDYSRYHYGHDQIVQMNRNYIDALRQSDISLERPTYSTQTILGARITVFSQFPRGLTFPLSNYIYNYYYSHNNLINSVYLALNIVFAFWAIISAILLFIISKTLLGNNYLALITSIAANPIFHRNSEESWLMIYVGGLLYALSIIYYYRSNKFTFISSLLMLLGIIITLRAQLYSYILYLPIITLFISPFIYYQGKTDAYRGAKSLVYFFIISLIGVVIEFDAFANIMNYVSSSTSDLSHLKPWQNLNAMEYSLLPLRAIFQMPMLDYIFSFMNVSWPWNILISGSSIYIGLPVLLFTIIGIFKIKSKTLIVFFLLLLFYQLGPIQLLFRFIVGGPFLNETSVKVSTYLIPIAIILSGYVLQNYELSKYKRWINKIAIIFLTVGAFQVIAIFFINYESEKSYIWTEGIVAIIAIIGLLLYLNHDNHRYQNYSIALMILVIPVYNGMSPIGRSSFFPSNIALAKLGNNYNELNVNKTDVGAILVDKRRNYWTKKPIHSNFWYSFPIRSINGFVTPVSNNISLLHWYQHFTNIVTEDSSKDFLIKDILNLKLYRHRHHLMATYIYDGKLSNETSRYFDITGVNYLVTKASQVFNDNSYRTVLRKDGVKILTRKRNFDPIRGIDKIEYIEDDLERIKRLLSDINFDISSTVVTDNKHLSEIHPISEVKVVNYSFLGNGNIIIKTNGKQGIVTTNIVYDQVLKANNFETLKKITIFKCNFAFMCLMLDNMDVSVAIKAKPFDYSEGIKYYYTRITNL
jgi:hypothetical protein